MSFVISYSQFDKAVVIIFVVSHGQGIDWDNIDNDGKPLKRELLKSIVSSCEPCDSAPPGMIGPLGQSLDPTRRPTGENSDVSGRGD